MAGDFQKNAFALPCFLIYIYFLHKAFYHTSRRAIVIGFFTLIALTHIGVLAITIIYTFIYLIIAVVLLSYRKLIVSVFVLLLNSLILVLGLLYFFDPERIQQLLLYARNPIILVQQSILKVWLSGLRGQTLFTAEGYLFGNSMGLMGIITVYLQRKTIDSGTKNILLAASLCSLVLASPFIFHDLSSRFSLMAFAPSLIPVIYLLMHKRWMCWISVPILIIVLFHSFMSAIHIQQPYLSKAGNEELKTYKQYIPEGRILIFTQHGLEWWVAWIMETHVTNNPLLVEDAWNRYDEILRLDIINSDAYIFPPQDETTGQKITPRRQHENRLKINQKLRSSAIPVDVNQGIIKEGTYFRLVRLTNTSKKTKMSSSG